MINNDCMMTVEMIQKLALDIRLLFNIIIIFSLYDKIRSVNHVFKFHINNKGLRVWNNWPLTLGISNAFI